MAGDNAQALLLQVSADTSKAVKRLDDLQKKLSGVADTADRSSKRAGTSLDRFFGKADGAKALDKVFDATRFKVLDSGIARVGLFGSALESLGPAGLVAAAGIGAAALAFGQAREAVRFADELADTADKLHVTTDALQEYRFAIRAAGGEEAGADAALESFSQTLGKAQEGLPKAQKGFLALGFTKAQIQGFTDVETTLPKVAAALEGLSDAQKDAAVSQLGLDGLKQLIEKGPAAMDEFLRGAKAAGVVMDSDLIARSKDLNDEIDTASRKVDIQLKSAFINLGPAILDAIKLMGDLAERAGDVVDAFNDIEHKRTSHLAELRDDFIARSKTPETFLFGGPAKDRERAARAQAELDKRELRNINDQLKAADAKPTRSLVDQGSHRSKSAPRDNTVQRTESVDAALAGAEKDILQAFLSLTDDVQARANLQREILNREGVIEDAKISKQQADIAADKTISDATKKQLIAKLEEARADSQTAQFAKQQLLDRQTQEALARQALDVRQTNLDGEEAMLRLQQGLATSSGQQQAISLRLVEIAYEREKAELEALIATKGVASAEGKLAQLRIDQLNAQQPGRREAATRNGSDAAREANSAIGDVRKQSSAADEHAAVLAEIERQRQGDLANEEIYAQAKAQIDARYNEQRLQNAQSFFGNLATLSQSSNKTLAAIGKAAAIAQATIDGILAVQKALASAPPPFNFALAAAAGVAAAVNVAKIAGMADGGPVQGPGGPRSDQVPIMASNGEFVVNAAAAQKNLALLHAINSGGVPRFANGGQVGSLAAPRLSGSRPLVEVRQSHFHLHSPVVTQDLIDQMNQISQRDSTTAYTRARRDAALDVGRSDYARDLNS